MRRAEDFIVGCVHIDDDIDSRDLLNAEDNWSYTVFFSAVGRFLDKKIEIAETDRMYEYAQRSLLNYAQWMLSNEYPFLDKPEILEFPTETWPAQDMRKSCVFYYAAKHSNDNLKKAFIEEAGKFFEYSVKAMKTFSTKVMTRPVTLLLQNGWVEPFLKENESAPEAQSNYDFNDAKLLLTKGDILKEVGSDLMGALKKTSFKKEYCWIRNRIRTVIQKN